MRNDNFRALVKKLLILPTSLDIFDIRQHSMLILCLPFCGGRKDWDKIAEHNQSVESAGVAFVKEANIKNW